MGTARKRCHQPNIIRKKLREYSFNLARVYLPVELEDYLLDIYNEEEFLDDEGCRRSFTQEDIWYGLRKPIEEYALMKRKMDDLLSDTDYLGFRSLTIRVNNNKVHFNGWPDDTTMRTRDDSGDIPF